MSKHISIRIVLKHDTEANWTTSTLVPLKGELIIYDIDANHAIPRFKLGDGENIVKNLPFYEEDKSLVGHTHDDRYYTESETNSKLATKLDSINPDQIDTVFDKFEEMGVDILRDDFEDEPDVEDLESIEEVEFFLFLVNTF